MTDFAGVMLSRLGQEVNKSGQVELPALFEGQVSLFAVRDLHAVLEERDGDVRGVKATHIADQHVGFAVLSRVAAVHLHSWGS